jgi:hypothetical protein
LSTVSVLILRWLVGAIQRKEFPLNVKKVSVGDLAAVGRLEVEHIACRDFFLECTRILWDIELY